MKYLIVGLGNIGPEYQDTRHNIGFNVLDAFAKASNAVFEDMRYGAVCEMKLKGRTLVLLKPNTYMNLSGKAVSYWMQKEKIALEDLLVIVDDLALPINALLGTSAYARLRFGIGNDFLKGQQIDYVLGTWQGEEAEKLPALLERGGEIITSFVLQGIIRTMNTFNTDRK